MKNVKRAILLVLCAVLLMTASVMGTMAYLQAKTSTSKNTFTVGKVGITLQEYELDVDGNKTAVKVSSLDDIKLVPGREIHKNPFITVDSDSEDCFIFVEIENDLNAFVTINWDASKWVNISGNIWAYKTSVKANDVIDVFASITCKNFDSSAVLDPNASLDITAYAVQAEGFKTDSNSNGTLADEAWGETFGK